jgi:hypothetical protein
MESQGKFVATSPCRDAVAGARRADKDSNTKANPARSQPLAPQLHPPLSRPAEQSQRERERHHGPGGENADLW